VAEGTAPHADSEEATSLPRYVHQFQQPLAYLAFSIPYVPSHQRRKLFSDLLAHPSAHVQQFSLSISEAGNDVAALNISSKGSGISTARSRAGDDGEKKHSNGGSDDTEGTARRALVWFQARQHAWESGSSWVVDGVARYVGFAILPEVTAQCPQ
jgi:hypothetical protein